MRQQKILLVTSRPERLIEFSDAICGNPGTELKIVASVQEALDAFRHWKPVLAIADARVGDISGLDLVRRLIEVNAFVFTAVLSDATEEAFHRHSEGLGILTRLPMQPGEEDACRLLDRLQAVLA